MPSSDAAAVVLGAAFALATCTSCPDANAQQAVGGYAVERLVASPAGAGWFALDNLELQGGLGGAAGISFGYAKDSLTLTSSRSPTALTVVAHEALTDFSFAATYDRFRVSLAFQMPLIVKGQSGVIDGYQYSGPSLDAGVNPDTMADARLGVDARLWGGVHDAFRLGVGGTLVVQSGQRSFYVTDGTWRGMVRVLAAGDIGAFTYAAHVGLHVRPLDDSPATGSARGSEALFGLGLGSRLSLGARSHLALIIGPELFGATAVRALFSSDATAIEALFSTRLEQTFAHGLSIRARLGWGAALVDHFGAPAARVVVGIELFDRGWKD